MNNENPLKPIAMPLLAISAVALPWQIRAGRADLFAITSLIGAAVLVVLYLRKSKYAATFLFWSTVPMYPLYFLMIGMGQRRAPTNTLAYLVLAGVWIGGLIYLWRVKVKYAAFMTAQELTTSPN